MLVEDNNFSLNWMQEQFKEIGANNLVIARNGIEAFNLYVEAALDNRPLDIIMMDMILPRVDGYQATKMIREYEHEHGIRPVFICANSSFI